MEPEDTVPDTTVVLVARVGESGETAKVKDVNVAVIAPAVTEEDALLENDLLAPMEE